jgi:hypothetical protein
MRSCPGRRSRARNQWRSDEAVQPAKSTRTRSPLIGYNSEYRRRNGLMIMIREFHWEFG